MVDLRTPQTDPDHRVIGNYLKGHGAGLGPSEIYYCDSYDPNQGFWLTSLSTADRRINVSERAIDRTMHTVYHNNPDKADSLYCNWGKLTAEEVEIIRNHQAQTGHVPYLLRLI